MLEPTRPHPMITMCTCFLPARAVQSRYSLRRDAASHPTRCLPARQVPSRRQRAPPGHDVAVTTTPAPGPKAGDVLELTVGEVVHGGWCVSRQDDTGWVIFVRHALPGERVQATVTQATARFARADATEILPGFTGPRARRRAGTPGPAAAAAATGSTPACPAQRALKAAVVSQQLSRIGGIDREVEVVPVGGDETVAAGALAGDRPGLADSGVVRGRPVRQAGAPQAPLARDRAGRGVPDRARPDHGRRRDRPANGRQLTRWRSASSPPPANGAFWSPARVASGRLPDGAG